MRIATTLIALSALVPAAAVAQATDSDEAEVAINGSVAPLCVVGPPSQASVDLGQLVETSGARVGRMRTLAPQTVTLPGSFCNFAGSVALIDATALVETTGGTTTPATGFARAVNYTALLSSWGGGSASATTAALADATSPTTRGTSTVQATPRITDLAVELSGFTAPGDALPVSGAYSGLVRVTLGPAAVAN